MLINISTLEREMDQKSKMYAKSTDRKIWKQVEDRTQEM